MAVKTKRRETLYSKSVTTVRLTYELKDGIVEQGHYDESIDEILRRLLPSKDLAEWILGHAKEDEKTVDQVVRRLLRVPHSKNGASR